MARPPSKTARSKMMRAALEILAVDGVSSFSIEEVVRRSGVAKTTLYRHFGGADGLIFAAVASSVDPNHNLDTGSLLGDLRLIQRHYLEVASGQAQRELFAWMITRSIQDEGAAARFRAARISSGPTVIALQRAIARGELPAETNIDLAMHLIQGPLISKRIIDNVELSDADFEEILTTTVAALTGRARSEVDG